MTDLQRIFLDQRANRWHLRSSTAEDRIAKLRNLRQSIESSRPDILEALAADLAKSPQMAGAEIAAVLADIDEAVANVHTWMAPAQIGSTRFPTARAMVLPEPRGTVAIFGAWNFPFNLLMQPLVPAIAAGNTVVLKPNELASATSRICAKIITAAFEPAEIAIMEGGVEVSEHILSFSFDHFFFTGSPAVGRKIMASAAHHLASVTLELGGKCPVIVDETADLKRAAVQLVTGRCVNSGQLCLAPDHVWIAKSVHNSFVELLVSVTREVFFPGGKLNKALLGRFINLRNFERVEGLVHDAITGGAQVKIGGGMDRAALVIEPTILTQVAKEATIMQNEIFGPVLPVLPFQEQAEVLDFLRGRGKPLALYIYGSDQARIDNWLASLSSGGVTINGVISHATETALPFGGVGTSGIGRYHGIHGFREFSHERSILQL